MTLDELKEHIHSHYEADSGQLFDEDVTVTVFRRLDNRKWFAAVKNIGCRYLGIDRAGRIDILNVKLEPRVVASLRNRDGFQPAWRMNQNNWVTILLDGSVADDEVFSYLDMAYKSAGPRGGKR